MRDALPGIEHRRAARRAARVAALLRLPRRRAGAASAARRRDPHSSSSPTGTGRCTSGSPRPGSRRWSTARWRPPRSARPSPTARSSAPRSSSRARAAHEAWHVGDTPEADVEGARAAGLRPVLIARDGSSLPGRHGDPIARRAHTLGDLTTDETPPPQRWLPPVATPPEPAPPPAEPPAVPLWAPFAALFAVYVVTNVIGAALIGVAMAARPVDRGRRRPAVRRHARPDGAAGRRLRLRRVDHRPARLRRTSRASGSACAASRSVGRAVVWAAGVYVAFWIVVIALYAIFGEPDDQALVDDVKRAGFVLALVIASASCSCVVAPVVEELFFRGFMFNALLPRLGVVWACADRRAASSRSATRRTRRCSPWSRWARSESGCASSTGAHSPLFRAWRSMHSTTRSPSARSRSLDPALFAGVVVLSVGAVDGGRRRRVGSSAGGRMRRAGLALAALAARAPPPPPPPSPPADAEAVRPGRLRRLAARGAHRPLVHGARRPAPVRGRRDGDVRVYRNGRKIRVKALTPKPVNGGTAGVATLKVKSAKPGRLLLRASHKATPALPTLRARRRSAWTVVRPSAGPGARARRCGCCRRGSPRCTTSSRAAASTTPAPAAP